MNYNIYEPMGQTFCQVASTPKKEERIQFAYQDKELREPAKDRPVLHPEQNVPLVQYVFNVTPVHINSYAASDEDLQRDRS